MENSNKKNKLVYISMIIIIVALLIIGLLFVTGKISFKKTSTNNEETTENKETNIENSNIIKTQLIDNLSCINSENTFNNITVKIEQKEDNMVCNATSIIVNDKEIKDFSGFYVESYEMYDDNVILLLGSTSAKTLAIYNTTNNKIVLKINSENLEGYLIENYVTAENIITINGKECGEQCGNKKTEYPRAIFEIEYANNSFSSPKLVEKLTS